MLAGSHRGWRRAVMNDSKRQASGPATRAARPARRFARIPRILPVVRERIETLAGRGCTYAAIARECQVSRATAQKYGVAFRPLPDHRVHLNELELGNLRELARHTVRLSCPRCRIPMLGFSFVPSARCTRCGMGLSVPLPRRS